MAPRRQGGISLGYQNTRSSGVGPSSDPARSGGCLGATDRLVPDRGRQILGGGEGNLQRADFVDELLVVGLSLRRCGAAERSKTGGDHHDGEGAAEKGHRLLLKYRHAKFKSHSQPVALLRTQEPPP